MLTMGGRDWEAFAVWLGMLGWALQGFVEFGLYIPALAWPAFVMLGWLLDSGRPAGVFYAVVVALVLTIATVLQLPSQPRATPAAATPRS
jgi:hypothetical protein